MLANKFISVYRTLNKAEKTAFKKHFKGLYSGQRTAIILLEYTEEHLRTENLKAFEETVIQKKIAKKINSKSSPHISNTFSDLFLALKKFLLLTRIEQQTIEYDIEWIHILNERQLYKKAKLATEALKIKLEDSTKIDAFLYLQKMQTYHLESYNMYNHKFNIGAKNLNLCLEYLDLFYYSTKLKYTTEVVNRKKLMPINTVIDTAFIEYILSNETSSKEPLLKLYSKLYELQVSKSLDTFESIQTLFHQHQSDLNKEDQQAIITYLINFIIPYTQTGKLSYFQNIFDLAQLGFQSKALLYSSLSIDKFLNIVIAACKLEKYAWAKNLITEYSPSIDKDVRQNTISLANAMIAFEQADFEQAQAILINTNFVDFRYKIRAMSILLRSAFKKEDYDTMQNQCLLFKRSVQKSKLPDNLISGILDFISVLEDLMKRKNTKEKIKEKIDDSKYIVFKQWLLLELNTYKKR